MWRINPFGGAILFVISCASSISSGQVLCPATPLLTPCTCDEDTLTIDCSRVTDGAQLFNIFQVCGHHNCFLTCLIQMVLRRAASSFQSRFPITLNNFIAHCKTNGSNKGFIANTTIRFFFAWQAKSL